MSEKKYNVLLLVADQFRYDVQGYVEKYPVQTPNLDQLAQEAVSFDNAYTSIPTCCPSRQSFYAGKRCESFGAYWNYNITMPNAGLPVEEYSFMRDFAEAGYETVHIGRPEFGPTQVPEDFGYLRSRNVVAEHRERFQENKPEITGDYFFDSWFEKGEVNETLSGYTANCVMEELDGFKDSEKPFFMTVCFMDPHPPYHPHVDFYGKYDHAEKWEGFEETFEKKPYIQKQQVYNWGNQDKTWDDWERVVRKYYAQVTELDHHIGRILEHLKKLGKYEDTIVVFTADHGDTCGSHRMFDKHYILYEDVTHVPLIIRAGDACIPARTGEYTVHNLDLGLTLLELNGITPSERTAASHSLVKVLQGKKGERTEAVTTYNGAQFGLYTQRCIKTDRWKYIWNHTDIDELYDLEKDPGELTNLIDREEYQGQLKILRERLLEVLTEEGDTFCTIGRNWAPKKHLLEGRKHLPKDRF